MVIWTDPLGALSSRKRLTKGIFTILETARLRKRRYVSESKPHQDTATTIVSPFQTMHFDVLSQIFQFLQVKKAEVFEPYRGIDTFMESPWNLSQTCRHWRDVALSMHGLWSSLSIDLGFPETRPSVRILALWLLRSQKLPITISLNYTCLGQPIRQKKRVKRTLAVLKVLLAELHRWQAFRMPYSLLSGLGPVDSMVTSAPISLYQVDLNCQWVYDVNLAWLSSIINNAPNFRKLTIRHTYPLYRLAIPWEQLHHVDLETPVSESGCLQLLHRAPHLVSCHFRNIQGLNASWEFSDEVHSPNLKHLHLVSQSHSLDFLLRRLVVPSLHTLELRTCDYSLPCFALQAMVENSSCEIHTLVLHSTLFTRTELWFLLWSLSPRLRNLHIMSDKAHHFSSGLVVSRLLHDWHNSLQHYPRIQASYRVPRTREKGLRARCYLWWDLREFSLDNDPSEHEVVRFALERRNEGGN